MYLAGGMGMQQQQFHSQQQQFAAQQVYQQQQQQQQIQRQQQQLQQQQYQQAGLDEITNTLLHQVATTYSANQLTNSLGVPSTIKPLTLTHGEILSDLSEISNWERAADAYVTGLWSGIDAVQNGDGLAPNGQGSSDDANGFDGSGRNNRRYQGGKGGKPKMDPEKEKKHVALMKRLSVAECRREVLETQYMSLRSHFVVAESQGHSRSVSDNAQNAFLQRLCGHRADALAAKRVRLAILRDLISSYTHRQESKGVNGTGTSADTSNSTSNGSGPSTASTSSNASTASTASTAFPPSTSMSTSSSSTALDEATSSSISPLTEAYKKVTTALLTAEKNATSLHPVDSPPSGTSITKILPWNNTTLPMTPHGTPLILSALSSLPDRTSGSCGGGSFGTDPHEISWVEGGLPNSTHVREDEEELLKSLSDDVSLLTQRLEAEIQYKSQLQRQSIERKRLLDLVTDKLTILRTEMEAVVNRHQTIMDTDEVRSRLNQRREDQEEERRKRRRDKDKDKDNDGEGDDDDEYYKGEQSQDSQDDDEERGGTLENDNDNDDDDDDDDSTIDRLSPHSDRADMSEGKPSHSHSLENGNGNGNGSPSRIHSSSSGSSSPESAPPQQRSGGGPGRGGRGGRAGRGRGRGGRGAKRQRRK